MMYGNWGAISSLGSLEMMLGMASWIIVLLIVVWAAIRLFPTRVSGEETALDILKKRYARGEISDAEFQRAKNEIS